MENPILCVTLQYCKKRMGFSIEARRRNGRTISRPTWLHVLQVVNTHSGKVAAMLTVTDAPLLLFIIHTIKMERKNSTYILILFILHESQIHQWCSL